MKIAIKGVQTDTLLVTTGDNPLLEKEDIESFVEFFDKTSSDIAFISAEADNPQGLGRVLKENDEFVKIVEESDATEEQKLTGTGEIFGSPAYMSPEQGKGQEVDARSDVYSLGCVMYESIVGVPPFEGRNAIETIMLHLNSPVAKLPKPAKGTNPVVYHDLENIIMRCLEKDPKDRYPSMAQLNDDLKSLSYGERLLQLQREKIQKSRLQLFEKIYKFGLIGFAISIIPYAVFSVYLDPNSWRKELSEALEDQDNADKVIQQIIRDLNPKEDMYNWNKAYLLWNQAQIYRLKSASNPNLLAFAEEKYQQAKVSVDEFSKEKGGYPRLIRSMKAMCNQGLVRCHLDAFAKIHDQATLTKLIAQAKSLYQSGKLDAEEARGNELVQALKDASSAVSLRRETLRAKGENKNDGVLLAQALELMAQALAPL
ncbi:MAG TPA: protein kinase, partial [Rhabdochlamydiaceae bacterium]|nr:protein kinase [Rhabdochlamydiaceae bacterium]